MSERLATTLREICDGDRGIQTGPFGSQLHAEEYSDEGLPVVMPQDLGDNTINTAQIARVPEHVAARLARHQLRAGDIVFSRRGDVTRRALVGESNVGWLCGTGCLRARPGGSVDSRFLSYLLGTAEVRDWLNGNAVGTNMLNLNTTILGRLPLLIPGLPEQQAIAEVLGALDDKIATNTALAATLLEFIHAEFSRRFDGRGLDVPLGSLATVVDCLHSKKPNQTSDGPILMQLNNIRDDGLVNRDSAYRVSIGDYEKWSRKFETRAWDLVITNVGRIGAVARIPEQYTVAIGRNMTGIRPVDTAESGSFLAAALLSAPVRREVELRTDAGSVMSALNVRSVPLLRLQDSTPTERREFHATVAPLFAHADKTLLQNRTLAATRDAILPQLMSGKLRVRDAEAMAFTAGATTPTGANDER